MELWWSAIVLGLASSLHCTVMCGPLIAAVGGTSLADKFVYHSGRILVYVALGLLFGIVGKSLVVAGIQNHLSVLAGIVIILLVVIPERFYLSFDWVHQLTQWKLRMVKHSKLSGLSRRGLFGMANGLLPCPMVYVALALALATGQVVHSMSIMALFGLGTVPLLAASTQLIQGMRWSPRLLRLKPLIIALLGVLLLVRGAIIEVPYLAKSIGWTNDSSADPVLCK